MWAIRPKFDSHRGMNISLHHYRFQSGYLSHPKSIWVQRPGSEADHSSPFSAEVKKLKNRVYSLGDT
jgi:hypothetical protein